MQSKIVFFDNHILVADKKNNILTQPVEGKDGSLEEECKLFLKDHFSKKGNVFLHAIHRLDKEVSGLVLFARTSKALSRLQEMSRERKITREYLALVEGKVNQKKQVLEHFLFHDDFHAKVVDKQYPEAKLAILEYEVLRYGKENTLLRIVLTTGRYHQIRAQLSAIGHPIVGDKKYQSNQKESIVYLHHTKMVFFHPVTKKELIFESLPAWFSSFEQELP